MSTHTTGTHATDHGSDHGQAVSMNGCTHGCSSILLIIIIIIFIFLSNILYIQSAQYEEVGRGHSVCGQPDPVFMWHCFVNF